MKVVQVIALTVTISCSIHGPQLRAGDSVEERNSEPSSGRQPEQPTGSLPPSLTPTRPIDHRTRALRQKVDDLSGRIAKFTDTLRAVEARLRRGERALPDPEEFRQQITDGRHVIESMRARVKDHWTEVERIVEVRGVTLDERSLQSVVPDTLLHDSEFLSARTRALEQTKLLNKLEQRLIEASLKTTFGNASPVRQMLTDQQAIAREWGNLVASQKGLGAAVQNARRKAEAAKVEFDPAQLLDRPPAAGSAIHPALVDARNKVAVRVEGRDAGAELVATLEFLKAIDPR